MSWNDTASDTATANGSLVSDFLDDVSIHPAANIFPLMDDAEFAALVRDIEHNDQRDPAVYWRGQLLDGRNRVAACRQLGIKPKTREIKVADLDPVAYVLSANLRRRHLNTAQRAIVAARLKALEQEQAKSRQKQGKAKLPDPSVAGQSRDKAGETMNVSGRTVDQAEKLLNKGIPELVEMAQRGEISISAAAEVAEADVAAQERAMRIGAHAVKQLAQRRQSRKRRAKERSRKGEPPAPDASAPDCVEEWEAVKGADAVCSAVRDMFMDWYWPVQEMLGDPYVTTEQIRNVQKDSELWCRLLKDVASKWTAERTAPIEQVENLTPLYETSKKPANAVNATLAGLT